MKQILLLTIAISLAFSSCQTSQELACYSFDSKTAFDNLKTKRVRSSKRKHRDEKTVVINTLKTMQSRGFDSKNYSSVSLRKPELLTLTASTKTNSFYNVVDTKMLNEELDEMKINLDQPQSKVTKANTMQSEKDRNQWVALLLAFFFGAIGVHRIYLGYIGIGIIQLLTLGGCGIWALVDFIRIILGDLRPKNGDYYNEI